MAGKSGVRMPCGWECGESLTAVEMRKHFTECPKRPGNVRMAAIKTPSKPADQPAVEKRGEVVKNFDFGA